MKKLNNKGLTIIELLVCFVIVAVIAISLLNIIMNYKNKLNKIVNLSKDYHGFSSNNIDKTTFIYKLTK